MRKIDSEFLFLTKKEKEKEKKKEKKKKKKKKKKRKIQTMKFHIKTNQKMMIVTMTATKMVLQVPATTILQLPTLVLRLVLRLVLLLLLLLLLLLQVLLLLVVALAVEIQTLPTRRMLMFLVQSALAVRLLLLAKVNMAIPQRSCTLLPEDARDTLEMCLLNVKKRSLMRVCAVPFTLLRRRSRLRNNVSPKVKIEA
jgi:hypothetical protein